jgi:hypothetical protein
MSDLDAPATKRDVLELRHDLEKLALATKAAPVGLIPYHPGE